MCKQETRRLRSFLWRMCHFLYFFSYIFNKNKEDCTFLINISSFGHFLLRKVQKSGFWKTILWLNLWLKLWLNSGFVLKLRHRLGRVTHLWRERVTRTRITGTLIFDNFPQSSTFCEIFTSKFCSVYTDCRRLQEIVKDLAHTFHKLLKIACPIVKD